MKTCEQKQVEKQDGQILIKEQRIYQLSCLEDKI